MKSEFNQKKFESQLLFLLAIYLTLTFWNKFLEKLSKTLHYFPGIKKKTCVPGV